MEISNHHSDLQQGSRDLPSNYWPISLTCVMCRVLVSIIADKLMCHMYKNHLIASNQFGFLPGRSTCSQLLLNLSKWCKAVNVNKHVDVIYTDGAKAFDTVSHPKLLSVLKSYGICNDVFLWICNFLQDRIQFVCVNNCISVPLPVSSDVPQGSVLGPFLFILYVNDLLKVCRLTDLHSGIYLYADDTKLFSVNSILLQENVNFLATWCNDRQLSLALHKCQHLALSRKLTANSSNKFCINSQCIASCSTVKDLGILISDDLKWSQHIMYITQTASMCSYQILRSFSCSNIYILLRAFLVYVRPKLEYNHKI